MKFYLLIPALFSVFLTANAQNLIESDTFKISFESAEVLSRHETESDSVLGYLNENYAVYIQVLPLDYEPKSFVSDLKYGANRIAKYLDLKDVGDGGKIPNIDSAHYALGFAIEASELIPVYVLFIVNNQQKTAFEITVYCYNQNLEEGERITESFRLLE